MFHPICCPVMRHVWHPMLPAKCTCECKCKCIRVLHCTKNSPAIIQFHNEMNRGAWNVPIRFKSSWGEGGFEACHSAGDSARVASRAAGCRYSAGKCVCGISSAHGVLHNLAIKFILSEQRDRSSNTHYVMQAIILADLWINDKRLFMCDDALISYPALLSLIVANT